MGYSEQNLYSFNRYAYGNNNPYRYVDPDGRSPLDIGFFIYDVGGVAVSLYTGVGIGSAFIDLGISTAGLLSPVPGVGLGIKAGRAASRVADSGSGFTSMYRAVSKAELDDIAARGFQLKPGGYESKLFATSADDAAAFGRDLYRLDRVPFHIVETRVPNSIFNQFDRLSLDLRSAIDVSRSQLPGLNGSMTWSEISVIPLAR